MTENKNINNKIELSLSAVMFFSPLIQNIIKNNDNLTIQEKDFVKGFIKIGYLNIFLLILIIGLQVAFYLQKIGFLETISTVCTIILTILLILGSIYAISGKTIISGTGNNENNNFKNTNTQNTLNVLLNYIPLYNIYSWYKNHNFENPNIILKESIIRWGLFIILFISIQNQSINRIFITILLIRIVALINGIDFGDQIKEKINNLFKKNPEEIRGYISGFIINIFNKKTLKENIYDQKNSFELLFKINNKQIIFEYIILILLSITGFYIGYIVNNILLIFGILFIISRYILMIINRNHLPHLPIIKEITSIFFKNKKQ